MTSVATPPRLFAAGALLLAAAAFSAFLARDWLRGYALYHGRIALTGRLAGQSFDLPAATLRCDGCHEQGARELARSSELSLDLDRLDEPRSRRGGPPSAYSAETFCAVLRTGLDPTSVTLARAMPRFEARDADCRVLWAYLSRK